MTAVKYGASNFITTEDGARLGGGANFFAGGPSSEVSAASQAVNVSGAATEIDAGQVTMTLSGLLGGWSSQEDAVTVTATALDAAGAPLATATLAPVTAAERQSAITLLPRTSAVAVPRGTRVVAVRMVANRTSGDYNDGYADNLSLSLAGAPVSGTSVNAGTVSGTVCVKAPGSSTCAPLSGLSTIRMGSTVDTRNGVVEITTAAGGKAKFYDGIFKITQKGAITDLQLVEALASCKKASAAAAKAKKRKLWGEGKGAFRTTGKYSAATVRGTKWLVQDSCSGTLTRVTQGTVNVRDNVAKRTVVVRAGKSYTAKPRR